MQHFSYTLNFLKQIINNPFFYISIVLFFSPILLQITSKELTYFCYFYSLSLFFAMFFSIKLGITPNNFYKDFYNK